MRIVSLVPSSTETLIHLGANVIACTRFCEQPHLGNVGGTKNPDITRSLRWRPMLSSWIRRRTAKRMLRR